MFRMRPRPVTAYLGAPARSGHLAPLGASASPSSGPRPNRSITGVNPPASISDQTSSTARRAITASRRAHLQRSSKPSTTSPSNRTPGLFQHLLGNMPVAEMASSSLLETRNIALTAERPKVNSLQSSKSTLSFARRAGRESRKLSANVSAPSYANATWPERHQARTCAFAQPNNSASSVASCTFTQSRWGKGVACCKTFSSRPAISSNRNSRSRAIGTLVAASRSPLSAR